MAVIMVYTIFLYELCPIFTVFSFSSSPTIRDCTKTVINEDEASWSPQRLQAVVAHGSGSFEGMEGPHISVANFDLNFLLCFRFSSMCFLYYGLTWGLFFVFCAADFSFPFYLFSLGHMDATESENTYTHQVAGLRRYWCGVVSRCSIPHWDSITIQIYSCQYYFLFLPTLAAWLTVHDGSDLR